jgi:hypothetical protein
LNDRVYNFRKNQCSKKIFEKYLSINFSYNTQLLAKYYLFSSIYSKKDETQVRKKETVRELTVNKEFGARHKDIEQSNADQFINLGNDVRI